MSKKSKDGDGYMTIEQYLKAQLSEKPAKAEQSIREYSYMLSDKKNGGKRAKSKLKQAELEASITELKKNLDTKKDELNKTDRYFERRNPDDHWKTILLSGANSPSVLALSFYSSLTAICLGAGFSTAYSNLLESQIGVFEQHPLLAASIAALVPIGGMCIKTIRFRTDAGRRRYTQLITASAMTSLAAWIGYFAQNFTGMSADISPESISENVTGPIFTVLQCATELLCGGTMVLKAQSIYDHLFGYLSYINPKHDALVSEVAELETRLEARRAEYSDLIGENEVLESEYNLDAENLLARFKRLNDQFQFNQSNNGDYNDE